MHDLMAAPPRYVASVGDVIDLLGATEFQAARDLPITGFSIDSRTLKEGQVFVAIRGQRVDGHRFIPQAMARGASVCLVTSPEAVSNADRWILVSDVIAALGFLAASHRRSLDVKLVGLTGSVGKTTTKDLLFEMMSSSFRTRKSEGNFNNTIGLPIEILKLRRDTEYMIAEMGMSFPGEIRDLTKMARPDMGLWLGVKAVHLANFENLAGIARAKAELVRFMEPGRTLVYNADDPLVVEHALGYEGARVSFGIKSPTADFQARVEPYPDWSGTRFQVTAPGEQIQSFYLPLVGRFNVMNALAACATASSAGVPLPEIANALKMAKPPKHRSYPWVFDKDVRLIDDTYNSNPHAVEQVLRCFASLAEGRYRWILLGDMLELGQEEARFHRDLGLRLRGYGFDRVTLVGPLCEHAYRAFQEGGAGHCRLEHFRDVDEALARMDRQAPAPARIWCKASRGVGLERVAEALVQALDGQPESAGENP